MGKLRNSLGQSFSALTFKEVMFGVMGIRSLTIRTDLPLTLSVETKTHSLLLRVLVRLGLSAKSLSGFHRDLPVISEDGSG